VVNEVNASNFGISGDDSDESAKWLFMRDQLIYDNPNKLWKINLEAAKSYKCSNPFVFVGLRRYVLDGNGSVFYNPRMTSTLPDASYRYLWIGQSPFVGQNSVIPSYLIDTVSEGSSSVSFVTDADNVNFSVGDIVFIHGLNVQPITANAFPPNLRYFEWGEVLSVDAGGQITLKRPLKYSYRSDWRDQIFDGARQYPSPGNFNAGAARITNWTAAGCCDYAHWKNITVPLVSDTYSISTVIGGARQTILEDCDIGLIFASEFENYNIVRSRVRKLLPDKVGGILSIDCSTITDNLTESTGIKSLNVRDTTIDRGCNLNLYGPLNIKLDGCKIAGDVRAVPPGTLLSFLRLDSIYGSGINATISNCECLLDTNLDYPSLIRSSGYGTYSIAEVVGNEIRLTDQTEPVACGKFDLGLFWASNGTAGRILHVRWDGTHYWHGVELSGPLTTGETIVRAANDSIVWESNRISSTRSGVARSLGHPIVTGSLSRGFSVSRRLSTSSFSTEDVSGFIGVAMRIDVNVIRAYSGTDASAVFTINPRFNADSRYTKQINLKVAGRRVLSIDGAALTEASDPSFTGPLPSAASNIANRLFTYTDNGGGVAQLSGTAAEQAIVSYSVIAVPQLML
jgi:hypothetical protein